MSLELWAEGIPDDLDAWLEGSGAVVDAIFGTGFAGAARDPAVAAIDAINRCGAPVVACDVASGVDASTGEVDGVAVEADLTVTFHAAKLGHFVAPGKWHTGELRVAPIGIPAGAPTEPAGGLIDPAVLSLAPTRSRRSTKFTSGQVVIAGGSRGLTGAVRMASLAAIRAGAGYATCAVPADLEAIFEQGQPEVMSVGCPSGDGCLAPASKKAVIGAFERATAGVFGPGLGRDPGAVELAREAVPAIGAALVIDADGLNAFAGRIEELAAREERRPSSLRTPASWGGCSIAPPRRSPPIASPPAARPLPRPAQSSSSRVTTRSSPTESALPSTRSPSRRSPPPAPATSSPGWSRPCSPVASNPSPRPVPRSSPTPAPAATPPLGWARPSRSSPLT